ncbi:oligosaccharide repeat unit polymerase [Micromonospora sp. 15K316]|uniref:oligosaccharide repeat unit polymerase n=1 Tax=Micromonospora sp. 15K316 TaxID=2530376 RepID=UPI00104CE7B5|nr:oligosaccharide repeat unit polymerase [Micromonospora sp. 15K316]TDC40221.1 oligosaccharide repeat unit polymerase [Micromonospora sp. 15K316]
MILLFLPVLGLAVVHYLVAIRRYGILSPDGLFVVCQLLMLYGTLRLINPASDTEVFYGQLMAAAIALYIGASLVTYLWVKHSEAASAKPRVTYSAYRVSLVRPTPTILAVVVISIVVTAAYFTAVGYSAFIEGLRGQLNGLPADIATLRLESYAGNAYFFPGYVNQFKNVILPSLALVLVVWSFSRGGLLARVASIALSAVALLALMATGQRGALVLFLLTVMVYTFLHNRRRLPRAALLVPVVIGLPLMLLSTYVLARSAGSTESPIRAAMNDLFARFINDNQVSGLAAFNYTSGSPVRNGGEWLDGLAGVLPGNRGSTLSAEVFYTMYGSTRGTSPPSLWGSIHYNVDTMGLILIAALLGVLLQLLTQRTMRAASYNSLELVGFSGVTVVLGTWMAGGLETPLNVGLVAYLGLWYWGSRTSSGQRHLSRRSTALTRRPLPRPAFAGMVTGLAYAPRHSSRLRYGTWRP